jgi:hypothetical protein
LTFIIVLECPFIWLGKGDTVRYLIGCSIPSDFWIIACMIVMLFDQGSFDVCKTIKKEGIMFSVAASSA